MKKAIVASIMLCSTVAFSKEEPAKIVNRLKPTQDTFYIYKDRGNRENNFIPSGWMGDYGDLKYNPGYFTESDKSNTCIKITVSAERKQQAGWNGIYWVHPVGNWGDKKGGYDLSPYKKLTFLARGEKGGELIDKFGVGGITGQTEEGDSDSAEIDSVELTKDWKSYTIDLKGLDMAHIIGGFVFAVNDDNNDNKPIAFYLDEIKFEK